MLIAIFTIIIIINKASSFKDHRKSLNRFPLFPGTYFAKVIARCSRGACSKGGGAYLATAKIITRALSPSLFEAGHFGKKECRAINF